MKPLDRKIARITKRIKQIDAARHVGCDVSVISKLENEGYSVSERLSNAYDHYLESNMREFNNDNAIESQLKHTPG